jgi:putative ABC transport system permease protein
MRRTVWKRSGVFGAAAPDLLFERLHLKLGDRLKLGSATFELQRQAGDRAGRVSDGFGFAPRLMISMTGLDAAQG